MDNKNKNVFLSLSDTKKQKILLLDYDAGNIRSFVNALNIVNGKFFSYELIITIAKEGEKHDYENYDILIIPGVGRFEACMEKLSWAKDMINNHIQSGKKILGVCVGMQILSDFGYEGKKTSGLTIIPGEVKGLVVPDNVKLPHVGWKNIDILRAHPIFQNIGNQPHFYFVHSYHFIPKFAKNIYATVEYGGIQITSIVGTENIFGFQFNPEKSGVTGQIILKNFINLRPV